LLTKYSYKTFYMTNHPCVFKLFFWRPSPAHPLTVCPYKSLFVFLRTGAVQPARTEDGGLLAAPSSGRRARLNTRGGACAPRMASRVRSARSTVRSARAEHPRELAQSGFRVGPTRPRLGVFALDERDRPNAPRRIRLVTPGWGRRTRAAPARRAIRRRGARARIVRLDSSFLGHCRARERFVPGCAGRGKKNVSACPRKRRHQGAQSHDAASHSVSHSRKITTRTLAR